MAKKKRPARRKKVAKAAKRKAKPAAKIHLTPREEEIFRLLSLGCTVKEAASVLKVAPSTADNHKARLMAKLGTDKAALLTRLALRYGVSSMRDKLSPAEKRRSGRGRDGWN